MEKYLTEILTFLWLAVAFFTRLFTHVRTKRIEKINNTVQLIKHLSTVPALLEADLAVRHVIRQNEGGADANQNGPFEKQLVTLLDYYEFIAQLYVDDAIDQKSVRHLRGRLIAETYQTFHPYIKKLRQDCGKRGDDLYRELELLAVELSA